MNTQRAVLLSGERGAGKSTLCLHLADELEGAGGIVCPGTFDLSGKKIGFRGLCIQSGVSWELGSVSGPVKSAAQIGKYVFSETGIQRSIDCIRGSLETPGGITIIDEIGPLELVNGGGFAPVLEVLEGAGDLLIVVRAEFVEAMRVYLGDHKCVRYDLTVSNRDALRREIATFFTGR